jgi:hypothetical protein
MTPSPETTTCDRQAAQPDPAYHAYLTANGYRIGIGPHTHGPCGNWWTGATTSHCSGCHNTFSKGAFDKHQRMTNGQNICLNPTEADLTAHNKPWGTLWRGQSAGFTHRDLSEPDLDDDE